MRSITVISGVFLLSFAGSALAKNPSPVAHQAVMMGESAAVLDDVFENTGHEWCKTPGFEPRSASDFSVQICPPEKEKPRRH